MNRGASAQPIPSSTLRYAQSEHIARDYDRVFADNALFAYDCELLDRWLDTPGSLLDLGCGTGRHVVHFAGRGFGVIGVDLSPHMLQVTRAKLSYAALRARLVQGDMMDLDALGVGVVDHAICMFSTVGMIQGHGNRVEFLRTVRRHVEAGGRLVLHVHNALHDAWSPWGPVWLPFAKLSARWRGLEFGDRVMPLYRTVPDVFLHLFTEDELRLLVSDSGWDILDLVHLNERRDGRLRHRVGRRFRSNGFVVLARNPRSCA